jgi:DNA-binding MarR family transcriptional regulator
LSGPDNSNQIDQNILELHQALSSLVKVYQFRDRTKICCYDVSVTQCYALEILIRSGPLTLKALAEELYLGKSTACRVVDALERKGYVQRSTSTSDARAINLRVRRQGRDLYANIEQELIATTAQLAADFEPEICRAATALLNRFTKAARERFAKKKV